MLTRAHSIYIEPEGDRQHGGLLLCGAFERRTARAQIHSAAHPRYEKRTPREIIQGILQKAIFTVNKGSFRSIRVLFDKFIEFLLIAQIIIPQYARINQFIFHSITHGRLEPSPVCDRLSQNMI
jgi:hypothetical protein